ncbi:hypothetical protein RFI_10875 [Reticulomyxa filosa]|uniref:BTB domain-containing protein n=1 Tax=Reticulomyxa filosa TaxID=46433 RepID=X6NIV3_RETFI|nr:hypothetical protein RFI_10875 [Reticulomyxa filosa]|eukprot:ETO26260.1 hypothetical protein RFI_10875 [Reticulomyxa filosa]
MHTNNVLQLKYDPDWRLNTNAEEEKEDQTSPPLESLEDEPNDKEKSEQKTPEIIKVILKKSTNENTTSTDKESSSNIFLLNAEMRNALCEISPVFDAMFSRWKNANAKKQQYISTKKKKKKDQDVFLPQMEKVIFEAILKFAMKDVRWRDCLKEYWLEVLMAGQEFMISSLVLECGKISYLSTLYTLLTYERVFVQFRTLQSSDQSDSEVDTISENKESDTEQKVDVTEHEERDEKHTEETEKNSVNILRPDNDLKRLYEFHIEAIAVKLRREFHSLNVLADYHWVTTDQIKRLIHWFYQLMSFEPQLLFGLVICFVEKRLTTPDMTLTQKRAFTNTLMSALKEDIWKQICYKKCMKRECFWTEYYIYRKNLKEDNLSVFYFKGNIFLMISRFTILFMKFFVSSFKILIKYMLKVVPREQVIPPFF